MDWVIIVIVVLVIAYVLLARRSRDWVGSDIIIVAAGAAAIAGVLGGWNTGTTSWLESKLDEGAEDGSPVDEEETDPDAAYNADVAVARQNDPYWDEVADALQHSAELDPYKNQFAYVPGYKDAYIYSKDGGPTYADLHRGPTAQALYQWGTDTPDHTTDKWTELARDPQQIWADGGERYHNMINDGQGSPESNLTAHHAAYRGELSRQNIERSVNTTAGTLRKYLGDELNYHEGRQWMDDYSDQLMRGNPL